MPDFNFLDLADLYDLLAVNTLKYTKMLSVGATNQIDFVSCKELIEKLQAAIESRQSDDDSAVEGCIDGLTPSLA
jgi:hypothetical protein